MRNEEYLNGRLDWNGCVSDLKEHEHCWIRRERKRKRGKKSWGPENWIQEIKSPWLCNSELHLYKNTLFHRPHLPVTDMQATTSHVHSGDVTDMQAATSHVHSGDVTDEAAAMWERDTQRNIYVYMQTANGRRTRTRKQKKTQKLKSKTQIEKSDFDYMAMKKAVGDVNIDDENERERERHREER